MQVNILGSPWVIEERSASEDSLIADKDGYCDNSARLIVIGSKNKDCELANFPAYQKKCLRHEIIHAFMFESGLAENMEHITIGIEETMVDWMAIQFPKIHKVFAEVGCVY